MNQHHMRVYTEESARLWRLKEDRKLTESAYRVMMAIPSISVARNVSVGLTREEILFYGKTDLKKFSRDYSCLIEHKFIKKIKRGKSWVYVVSPALYFNGGIGLQQIAYQKWLLGDNWSVLELRGYFDNLRMQKMRTDRKVHSVHHNF